MSAFRVPPMSESGVCTVTELMPKTGTENRQAERVEEQLGDGQTAMSTRPTAAWQEAVTATSCLVESNDLASPQQDVGAYWASYRFSGEAVQWPKLL